MATSAAEEQAPGRRLLQPVLSHQVVDQLTQWRQLAVVHQVKGLQACMMAIVFLWFKHTKKHSMHAFMHRCISALAQVPSRSSKPSKAPNAHAQETAEFHDVALQAATAADYAVRHPPGPGHKSGAGLAHGTQSALTRHSFFASQGTHLGEVHEVLEAGVEVRLLAQAADLVEVGVVHVREHAEHALENGPHDVPEVPREGLPKG